MHVVLDGVFNHVSDDSIYFDRYYKYLEAGTDKVGAYPYWAYVYDTMSEKDVSIDEAQTISAVHPNTMVQCIKDNANMVMVSINYRLDFGKKWNKSKRTLRNDGVERGVDVNY